MKGLANDFAQLAAIIMILITLAVSTAAITQWAGAEKSAPQTSQTHSQALSANSKQQQIEFAGD